MRKNSHPGIYLLPNLLTTASLFAAFYSIVASFKGFYETAIAAIFIGMIADGLDGRMARLTNAQSAFGAEYDSLSDMVTFGVAPALLLYSSYSSRMGKFGWLTAFVYTAAVALRLARFNTQLETSDKRYFQGLSCPAAAALLASSIWLGVQHGWRQGGFTTAIALLALTLALLMVSNVRYYSFKDVDFNGKVPFLHAILLVILFVAIASNPSKILFVGFLIYALSGPVQTLFSVRKAKTRRSRKSKRNKEEN